jgi:hypothetical protein
MKTVARGVLAVLAVVLLLVSMREGFRPEFLDESGYRKTLESKFSSYDQVTNHFKKTQKDDPVEGSPTAHRVNQYFGRR